MAAPDAAAAAAAAAASSSLPPKLVMKVIFSSRPGVGERERERDSELDSEGDLQMREGAQSSGSLSLSSVKDSHHRATAMRTVWDLTPNTQE